MLSVLILLLTLIQTGAAGTDGLGQFTQNAPVFIWALVTSCSFQAYFWSVVSFSLCVCLCERESERG